MLGRGPRDRHLSHSSAFFSLDKRLQHSIVHQLGWRQLRPVQEASIPPLLAGHDAVILAPTAGGKTESALLPLLSRIVGCQGTGVLYLCPLKALINNLLPRLEFLTQMIGGHAFAWHGEVSAGARKRFLKEQGSVLLTTPESLQVILSKGTLDPAQVFQGLQSVVIDEVHAFCGEARGDQLSALLAALDQWCGRPLQRVGLSATVGNPEHLLQWLSDGRQTTATLIDPAGEGSKKKRRIEIHPVSGEVEECAGLFASLLRGVPKSLLFVDSRAQAELVKQALAQHGIEALAHHSSLSLEMRERSEAAFRQDRTNSREAQVIVCTSTLELGLDVGNIDRVYQLGAPTTVSALLQRFGRAGRREDSVGHMVFVTDRGESFLRAVALIRLAARKWVEDVRPVTRSFCILVQQMLLQVVRDGAIAPHLLWERLGRPWCFSGIDQSEREQLLSHLLEEEWLVKAEGRLRLGERTEKAYGRSHFFELLSVFTAGAQVSVQTPDGRRVGTIDSSVAAELITSGGAFLLAGQSWKPRVYDERAAVLTVAPSMGGRTIRWSGSKGEYSFSLAREMRALLTEAEPLAFLGPRAAALLQDLRSEYGYLESDRPVGWRKGQQFTVETWAGEAVNRALELHFCHRLGVDGSSNYRGFTLSASERDWETVVRRMVEEEWSLPPLVQAPLLKFSELLPPAQLEEVRQASLFDPEPTRQVSQEIAHTLILEPVGERGRRDL